jgi:hypothetical protein
VSLRCVVIIVASETLSRETISQPHLRDLVTERDQHCQATHSKGELVARCGIGGRCIVGIVLAVLALTVFGLGYARAGNNTIWTLAGTTVQGDTGDGGQAREAQIALPRSVSPTNDGGYIFAEPWSDRVRKVGPDGIISTFAGTGVAGFSGDGGPATAAQVNFVHAAAPMSDGSFLLADTLNRRIRKVSSSEIITTVAGTGDAGYGGDGGPASAAQINNPRSVVGLADGGFLIPDTNNHRVRKVSPSGIITTVAGTGASGFSGDGDPATEAMLSLPFGVAPTPDGGFLIVDVGNQRIRKVSAEGIITTVAGTGVAGYSGDGGPATAAQINNPHNVASRPDGAFLIADASNERVRQVSASGTITTLTGTGVRGYSGDGGPSDGAPISVPKGVAVTAANDVLIAEEQNHVIRFVGTVAAPSAASPPSITGSAVQSAMLTAFPGGWSGTGPMIGYQWRRCDGSGASCADIAGASSKTYTVAAIDVGATLRVAVTASNSGGSATATSAQTAEVTGQTSTATPTATPTSTSTPTLTSTSTPTPTSTSTPTPTTRTLTVTKMGSGSGTVTGSGINCGATCQTEVATGTQVTLTAVPAAGTNFGGWSGACSGTGSCVITMDAAKTVTATFQRVNAGVQVGPAPAAESGGKALAATLTARAGCGPIAHVHFGTTGNPFNNANVSVSSPAGGPSGQTVGFLYTPPAGTTSVSLVIRRVVQAGGATVNPIDLHDGCGEWRTFVGGGANAFQ